MKILKIILLLPLLFTLSCEDVLDKQPLDKLTAQELFRDPEGVKLYMANLYNQLPIEDFTYFRNGFNINNLDPNNGGMAPAVLTDEAVHSQFGDFLRDWDFTWWEPAFRVIRDVNMLIDFIPTLDITEEEATALRGETAFIRAYTYFGLAKRYGGVPLISSTLKFEGDVEALKIPRATEKETWDFILKECDVAINGLSENPAEKRRATKWAAYALKSRVALHAASLAKFGSKAPLSGDAVDMGYVVLDAQYADEYYKACIEASEAIINSQLYSLYQPSPGSPEEAAENYRQLFDSPNNAQNEVIFLRGYAEPGNARGHNYDIWYNPAQVANGWPHPGRMNPTLGMVDTYENYSNPGQPAPIVTTADGLIDDYSGFDPSKDYLKFDNPYDIFEGKDARLWGTAILPGTVWKDQEIVIQAGFVKPNGEVVALTKDQITVDGTTYYTYGAPQVTQYSGFDTYGGNNTRSGFSFKKFLDRNDPVIPAWNQSTTDFIDFRYAEILLNYAEAVVESGFGDAALAAEILNDIRQRAGYTTDIPLTVDNVLRERRVELAYENKRYWDLVRRRDYHIIFNNKRMTSLFPLLDLRESPPKYIFVRAYTPNLSPRTFDYKWYYKPIPGIGANGLVQNPQY